MSEPSPLFANRPERKRRRDRSGRGPPSDVVRFRGVLLAALLGLVTLGVVLSLDLGANGALSKGPDRKSVV